MTAKKNDKLDKAFTALLSDDDAKALAALAVIDRNGDARSIRPLLQALVRTNDPARQQGIHHLLFQVKADGAAQELIAALDDAELRSARKTILATFWNAGLDASPHVQRLIEVAAEGDAEECFECLTVLENQEVLPEKAVLQGIRTISKAIADNTDEYRGAMLGSLLVELKARVGKD